MRREQQNHTIDCYFCSIDVRGFNTRNKTNIFYPNPTSAIRPVPHTSEIPVPHPPSSLDDIRSDSEDEDTLPHQVESISDLPVDDEGPQPFSLSQLNNLERDLGLSKDGAELLGSRLKNKNMLTPRTSFSWHRHREEEFTQFISKEGNLVFRNDVQELMNVCFPENLGAYSEEQGDRFHQDVRDIERRSPGRRDVNMLADYYWILTWETEVGKRKRVRRSVIEKKKRFHRQKE
ncbi:hypothetical protein AVEN_76196-1 [Araneus ventricosus]|uniref:Uncharacterized protein n=1 Tax=Araneus ventricosus TaxID=182803 RepID=A0A4Y2EZW4_ARAVE|nr:hypothetical protein AVEN_76196-1 [Araneus ventricosus]